MAQKVKIKRKKKRSNIKGLKVRKITKKKKKR